MVIGRLVKSVAIDPNYYKSGSGRRFITGEHDVHEGWRLENKQPGGLRIILLVKQVKGDRGCSEGMHGQI